MRATLFVTAFAHAIAAASIADAQVHDHLQCFKVKDGSSYAARMDMRPLHEPPFPVSAGCRVKVRSRELCIPVEADVSESTAPSLDIEGQQLAGAFLCYSVKCSDIELPAGATVSDRFGTRELGGIRTSKVCTPAIFGSPPVTTTTTLPSGTPRTCENATPPSCDGTCGDQNFACIPDAGACICDGVDVFFPCGLIAGPPDCHGSCDGQGSCVSDGGACGCALVVE